MSVGRRLCHELVDASADLRRYSELLEEFTDDRGYLIVADAREIAERIESLIPRVLAFEGERLPALAETALA